MRPLLTPAMRRLWRDQETLQLGRPPGRAVVLAGVDPVRRAVLALLDGTRDRDGLLQAAAAVGSPPPQTEQVLALLDRADLLDDAGVAAPLAGLERGERDRLRPDALSLRLVRGREGASALGRRRAAGVLVLGAGRVGAAVAGLLAAAGVGAVQVVDEGVVRPVDCAVGGLRLTDVGRRRDAAVTELLGAAARSGPVRLPDLVILAPAAGEPMADPPRQLPHLAAEVRDGVGVVGPLVRPGMSACLRCLDLERTDRDPDWPVVALQLSAGSAGAVACDSALALAVAAQTALQAAALLDDDQLPAALGGTLELALPDWRWRRRSWQLHPDCDCHGVVAQRVRPVARRIKPPQATLEA